MAIKIISDKPDKSVLKRVVCDHCGAKLEYAPIDVKEYYGNDWGYKWIDCPKCNHKVVLESW